MGLYDPRGGKVPSGRLHPHAGPPPPSSESRGDTRRCVNRHVGHVQCIGTGRGEPPGRRHDPRARQRHATPPSIFISQRPTMAKARARPARPLHDCRRLPPASPRPHDLGPALCRLTDAHGSISWGDLGLPVRRHRRGGGLRRRSGQLPPLPGGRGGQRRRRLSPALFRRVDPHRHSPHLGGMDPRPPRWPSRASLRAGHPGLGRGTLREGRRHDQPRDPLRGVHLLRPHRGLVSPLRGGLCERHD